MHGITVLSLFETVLPALCFKFKIKIALARAPTYLLIKFFLRKNHTFYKRLLVSDLFVEFFVLNTAKRGIGKWFYKKPKLVQKNYYVIRMRQREQYKVYFNIFN